MLISIWLVKGIMKHLLRLIIVTSIFIYSIHVNGAELFSYSMKMDNLNTLLIHEKDDQSVSIKIVSNDHLQDMVTVHNAMVTTSAIKKVIFCEDCETAILIKVGDRSSTFGKVTGIIVWDDGWGWRLQVLPLTIPEIEDSNKDGFFEIIDRYTATSYTFRDGKLCEK